VGGSSGLPLPPETSEYQTSSKPVRWEDRLSTPDSPASMQHRRRGLSRLSHFILHFSAGCGSGDEMRTFLAITPGPSLLHPLPLSQGRIE